MITSGKKITQDDKFSTITEYNICDDEELDKVIHNLQSSHFTNLQVLRAKNCKARLIEFLSILLERSYKIEVINIEQYTWSHPHFLFDTFKAYKNRDGGGDGELFTQLKELKLTKVCSTFISASDKPTIINLENLQILPIKGCIFLQYVFSLYPPEKLHQLKELVIEACEALSTVFESHVDEVSPITKFPLLNKVEFKSLPKLRQIYNGHLEFPSLQSLMIEKCPILTKFTTGFAGPLENLN